MTTEATRLGLDDINLLSKGGKREAHRFRWMTQIYMTVESDYVAHSPAKFKLAGLF